MSGDRDGDAAAGERPVITLPSVAESGGDRIWVDDAPVDPAWPAPRTIDPGAFGPPPARRSRWLTRGLPALIVVGVLVAVWALGGFRHREDRVTEIAPGQRFTNGAFVITLDSATIQRKRGYGEDPIIQEVVVHGTAKNIWTESLSPRARWFAAADRARTFIREGTLVQIDYGDEAPNDTPSDLTPGLPAMPVTVDFEFPKKFDPGPTISVGMNMIDYGNHSVTTTNDEKTWDNSSTGFYRVELPVTVLQPDDDY